MIWRTRSFLLAQACALSLLGFLIGGTLSANNSIRAPIRELQTTTNQAITLLESGKGAHAVRVSQTFIGDAEKGCTEGQLASNASLLFATFLDPDTLQETCGIFKRDATPCFEKTVVIGCNLETDTATINVYVLDESYPKSMTTENPRIGRCRAGGEDIIQRANKITETFDCLALTEEEKESIRFNTCSETTDYCAKGTYCSRFKSNGYKCKPYDPVGASCGGFSLEGKTGVCNIETSFCLYKKTCAIPDSSGVCTSYGGDCQSDDDCTEPEAYYCDVAFSKCKPRLRIDDCCSMSERDQCAIGLECREPSDGEFTVGTGAKCQPVK